jgi:hypothetical protein
LNLSHIVAPHHVADFCPVNQIHLSASVGFLAITVGERQPYYNHLYSPQAEQVVIVEGQANAITLFGDFGSNYHPLTAQLFVLMFQWLRQSLVCTKPAQNQRPDSLESSVYTGG